MQQTHEVLTHSRPDRATTTPQVQYIQTSKDPQEPRLQDVFQKPNYQHDCQTLRLLLLPQRRHHPPPPQRHRPSEPPLPHRLLCSSLPRKPHLEEVPLSTLVSLARLSATSSPARFHIRYTLRARNPASDRPSPVPAGAQEHVLLAAPSNCYFVRSVRMR
jgi:hypothetical protein